MTSDPIVDPPAARAEIAALLSAYPFALDEGRRADLLVLFGEDGTLTTPFGSGTGPVGIGEHLDHLVQKVSRGHQPQFLRHHITSQEITLEKANRATARSYFLVLSDAGLDHWGRYEDVVVATKGGWRIAERTVTVEGSGEGSWYGGLPVS